MNQKVKVRCLSINPEHAIDESVPQNLTIGKVYDGWGLEVNCLAYGQSVYITDDAGEESALFGDEFEVVTEQQ
jgi:hypothetical protein